MEAASLGAASVAGELLAFYRNPARHRPPYLHHEVPMPDGQVVFRLALGRFPHGWVRDLPSREREEVREAAASFVRQVCLWERATHYQVLCVDPDASRGSVKDNYHLLIALIHPDRHEPGSAWPTGCAQRANQAYEVLADEARRAEYDAGLLHAEHGATLDAAARVAHATEPARHRRRFSAASFFKRFAVVAGVVAALFIVQAWWVGGSESPQHSLLERAIPASGRWVREVLPDTPRFLSTVSPATVAFDPGDRMEPLKEPRRLASLGTWVPMREATRDATPALAPPVLVAQPTASSPAAPLPPAAPSKSPAESAPLASRPSAPIVLAQVPAPVRVAQAPASPSPVAPSRDQIELLVAALVGYYDSGDAEQLVGLVDPDRLGWFGGFRLRGAYADFFAATRSRRLRMEQIAWQQNGAMAQARGEATVMAEYADGRPRLERRVPIELDIALREGQARITRLVLFPGGQ